MENQPAGRKPPIDRFDREDTIQIDADTTLIEAARRIAPVIQEHNQEAERERRLSPPVLAALHEAGLLPMCTPRSLGGLEVDPLTRALVIEEISGNFFDY